MEKIAIIGSGIAGLGCAHFLHGRADVSIFEANRHVGGHSHTVEVHDGESARPVDTGFMVYNEVTYPLLTRLFQQLEVKTKQAPMSFSVQHGGSGLEWNGRDLNTLFAQRRNLLNPRHWKFLLQLNRFNKEAVDALQDPRWAHHTLERYVLERGYGADLLERYLIPMSAAVWSAPRRAMLAFPARTLLRFWYNHGFLGLNTRHPWRTIEGGSRQYVRRLANPFADRIRTSTPVQSVVPMADGVAVTTCNRVDHFDKVILATHADQALRLLGRPTELQRSLLGAFAYQGNDVDLHSDASFMPKTKNAWACWNYRTERREDDATVHYWMNALQGVSENRNFFVSLNARDRIRPEARCHELHYEHPMFDAAAVAAQSGLAQLNDPAGGNRVFFCGSYFRYGFHEDAFKSAVDLCGNLLGGDPWR